MDLLDKMATFVRVVESGSLSAAAKQLRISAAAVSRQISTLEDELGITLLARTTRSMTVTESGRRYYERCLRILRDVDDAQSLGRSASLDGFVLVSAPISFGFGKVAPNLHALMRQHPGLRIDLRLDDRMVDLAAEGVDVAIRVGGALAETTDLIALPLLEYRRVLVAAPSYLKQKGEPKTPEALAKHDALNHVQSPDSWTLTSDEREARVRVAVVFRSNSFPTLRELTLDGAGVAFLPDWMVGADVKARTLKRVLPAFRSEPIRVNAIYRREQRGTLRIKALIEHLRATMGA